MDVFNVARGSGAVVVAQLPWSYRDETARGPRATFAQKFDQQETPARFRQLTSERGTAHE